MENTGLLHLDTLKAAGPYACYTFLARMAAVKGHISHATCRSMIELPMFVNGIYLYFKHPTCYSDWDKDQDMQALALQRKFLGFIFTDFFFVAYRTLKGEEPIGFLWAHHLCGLTEIAIALHHRTGQGISVRYAMCEINSTFRALLPFVTPKLQNVFMTIWSFVIVWWYTLRGSLFWRIILFHQKVTKSIVGQVMAGCLLLLDQYWLPKFLQLVTSRR